MGKFSFPYQICNSVLSLLTVLSHPPHRLALGSGTAANASRWGLALPQTPRTGVWHCRKRLSMGSGLSLRPITAANASHWGLALT